MGLSVRTLAMISANMINGSRGVVGGGKRSRDSAEMSKYQHRLGTPRLIDWRKEVSRRLDIKRDL